jgi:predicted amidohydrolase YtcJ
MLRSRAHRCRIQMENIMPQDSNDKSRRQFLANSTILGAAGALWSALPFSSSGSAYASSQAGSMTADLILFNGKLHTVDREKPMATAVAIKDGRFIAVGTDGEAMAHKSSATQIIDLKGRTVIPGLNDSHLHLIRGGLNYNLELRWEGVPSVADALRLLKDQAARTPTPQWVRVVGGWNEFQFAEKRMPTLEEINQAAPDTPVFLLHLYDRALLNRAALKAVGYTKDTPNPPGGEIQRNKFGEPTGLLIARPNAMILYATLAKGPKLPLEYQVNSTRQFMRELNRLGLTSAIDAGGGYQNYPDDYQVIQELADRGQLTVRIAYNLFTQKPKEELADFKNWSAKVKPGDGTDFLRHNGAGEMLVFSAADFEDFLEPRPDLPQTMEQELEPVVRHLVEQRWPFRLHATYNESISRMLDVFEKVNRDIPFNGLPWFFDHAETISSQNIERVRALGGGIAIQDRMAFQGEYFVDRYGAKAAEKTPPIQRMLAEGIPVGAGTDATRVSSYNPWTSLYWLVSGKTVGGMALYPEGLSRETALQLFTHGSAWFSSEQGKKGQIKVGQMADLAALSLDFFSVDEEAIKGIESVLTIVDGKVVYGAGEFDKLGPAQVPVLPEWSPVAKVPGHWRAGTPSLALAAHQCVGPCGVHAHSHERARHSSVPVNDYQGFWGALGCSCFAF